MKAILLILWLCFALIFTKNSFAESSDSISPSSIPDGLMKEFTQCVCFPKIAIDHGIEGNVTTCFFITPEGKIEVSCINGPPILAGYVRQKIEGIKCCNLASSMVNKPMYISFNFRIE